MSFLVSIYTIAKGAIFLANSAVFKGFIVKSGMYIAHHYSLATIAKAAVTASAITGTVLVIDSTVNRAKEGFCKMIDGMFARSYSQFIDGIYQLVQSGMSASSIVSGFYECVDNLNCDNEIKTFLKQNMDDLKGFVYDQIGQNSISLLKEAEELLRQNSGSNDLYKEQVNAIYHEHTDNITDDYTLLLGRAGRIYSDMCNLNILSGLRKEDSDEYDHFLVYCIAGWFKDHLTLDCLWDKSQKEIADDITNYILDYLQMSSFSYYWR